MQAGSFEPVDEFLDVTPQIQRVLSHETLGKLHFWPSLIFINGIFGPMFIQGLAGVSRRLYDGGQQYAHAQPVLEWNQFMSANEFDLATYWSGSASRSKTAFGLPVEFVIPKEGAIGWLDGKRPRMVAVQAEGCAPIVRAFEAGE